MIIGLFGGSFNPIHNGHLIIAEYCRCLLKLDRILFIPTGNPPHKSQSELLDEKHRAKMVQIAVEDNPFFDVSDIELNKKSYCYTIDTVKRLISEKKYQNDSFRLLIGADSMLELHTWKSPVDLLELIPCIVMKRPGSHLEKVHDPFTGKYQKVETPLIQISSSEIRKRIQQQKSIRYLVPDKVREYMEQESLYQ